MELPAFIEVTPDEFKAIEDCSKAELSAAVEAYVIAAVMLAREAVAAAEEAGEQTAASNDLMAKSVEKKRLATDLAALAEAR